MAPGHLFEWTDRDELIRFLTMVMEPKSSPQSKTAHRSGGSSCRTTSGLKFVKCRPKSCVR